jgi:ribosomal-protein-alanine N-acetyltransferase
LQINLTEIVRGAFHACYLGFSLAADQQSLGYVREAARSVIAFAFDDLGLHRIMANYMPENARSAATLAALGFQKEGLARGYLYIAGAWRDHVLTALTKAD